MKPNQFVANGHERLLAGQKGLKAKGVKKETPMQRLRAWLRGSSGQPSATSARRQKMADHKPSPGTLW